MSNTNCRLTRQNFQHGLNTLTSQDKDLAAIVTRFGPPRLRHSKAEFSTLVRIIIEQQLSLAAGATIFQRMQQRIKPFTANHLLQATDQQLRDAGVSKQKVIYCRCLSEAVVSGDLNIDMLHNEPDETVRNKLMSIKGIGRWTADIYLLSAMRRSDIWPRGDLALNLSIKKVKRLRKDSEQHIENIAAQWSPWRSIAAKILWKNYTSLKNLNS